MARVVLLGDLVCQLYEAHRQVLRQREMALLATAGAVERILAGAASATDRPDAAGEGEQRDER